MATYTADAAQSFTPPRFNEDAPTIAEGFFTANGSVAGSSGDVIQMVKIPNGAVIYDIKFAGRVSGTGGQVWNLGTSGSASLFGPVTVSATDQYITVNGASATTQLPYVVSVSDDTQPQHLVLQLSLSSGTATNTGTYRLIVTYAMRGQARFS
jgi:hypothetical protein